MKGCFTCLNLICFPGACDQQQVDENYSTCLYELQDILGECTFDCYKGICNTVLQKENQYNLYNIQAGEIKQFYVKSCRASKSNFILRGQCYRLCPWLFRNFLQRP